jgi:hypothetical protein
MVAQAYYEVNRLYCRKLNNLIINQIRFAKMKRIFGKTIRGIYWVTFISDIRDSILIRSILVCKIRLF